MSLASFLSHRTPAEQGSWATFNGPQVPFSPESAVDAICSQMAVAIFRGDVRIVRIVKGDESCIVAVYPFGLIEPVCHDYQAPPEWAKDLIRKAVKGCKEI